MKKLFLLCLPGLFLAACAVTPKMVNESPQQDTPQSTYFTEDEVESVLKSLELSPQFEQIGYYEMGFNPCSNGVTTHGCAKQIYMTLNFQLVCRDTDGTVEHSDHTLRPFANKSLALKLGPHRRNTQTDADGYTQMQVIHPSSLKGSMLVLESPPFILGVRAREMRKIVVPNDWCGT